MSKWTMVKLSEAFDLQMGKTPSRSNMSYWNDGSNKWISIADIGLAEKYIYETKETISDLAVIESGIKVVPKNTVIMSFKLSLGKTCIVPDNMYTNEAIMAFIDRGHFDIDENYIYYLFKSKDWSSGTNKAVKGATLNKGTLSNIEIPLPPLETQKQIAKTLDTAAELLAMRKQQLAELDNLIKSTFYDIFGDPITNEKGWDKKRLCDECEIITGNTPSRKNNENFGNYIEWIKSDNINIDDMYLSKASEYLSQKGFSVCRFVDTPSVLMTCIAGSIQCIGNVGIADRKVAFNQQINAIVPKKNNVLFLYSLFLLTKKYIQSTVNISLKGILSKGKLSELEFIFPPIELQTQFAVIVTKIEEQKALVKKAIDETQYLSDSLMSEYFE